MYVSVSRHACRFKDVRKQTHTPLFKHTITSNSSVRQCVVVCCSVLQCVAACCSVLQYDTASCSTYERVSVLQCVAVCCSVLQCVAMRCSVVQCGVMFCSVLQYIQIYAYVYICIRNKNQRFSAAPQTLIANSVEGSYESPSASKRIADHSQEYICVYAHIQMYIYIYNKMIDSLQCPKP